jgi:hypothetical protein
MTTEIYFSLFLVSAFEFKIGFHVPFISPKIMNMFLVMPSYKLHFYVRLYRDIDFFSRPASYNIWAYKLIYPKATVCFS